MSKKFAVIKGEIVDNIALGEDPLNIDGLWVDITGMSPEPLVGWGYVNGAFVPAPVIPYEPPSAITKVAFRFRFTDAEYVGILTAAKTDMTVAGWVETFNMLSFVDLKNQRTIDGVNNLVNANLLTPERANEILTAPVQPGEMV